jgi:hypothetical protein
VKILRETVRRIDWGLIAVIVCVAAITFMAARIGSISRNDVQKGELDRVERKIERLIRERMTND